MRKIAVVIALLALAGCRTAQDVSDAAVCEGVFYGPPNIAAQGRAEAARRGINCDMFRNEAALLYQERILRRQAANQQIQQMFAPKPTLNCTTTSAYGIANTTCR